MKIKSETLANRVFYLDFLKFIAIFMVIAIHVASIAVYKYNLYAEIGQTWNWLASVFVDAASQCCIGIFFIVSGILLLDPARPPESPGQFFRRRTLKIIIVFLVWQLLYMIWPFFNQWGQTGAFDSTYWQQFLNPQIWLRILAYPSYYHLWYLQALIGVYLITPPLRTWLKVATKKEVEYVILIWLIMVIIMQFISRFTGLGVVRFNYLLEIGGFYLLGYYFVHAWKRQDQPSYLSSFWRWQAEIKKADLNWLLLTVYLLNVGIIFFAAWFFTAQNHGTYDTYWKHYISLPNIFTVISLFWLVKRLPWKKLAEKCSWFTKGITRVASLSLGIYLLHLIILEMMRWPWFEWRLGVTLDGNWPNLWLGIPLISAIIYFISYWLVKLLKLIPLVKNLV